MKIPNLLPNKEMVRRAVSTPSAIVLVVMNLIPVYGVFFLNWDVGYILAIYWLENVAIGVINVFKILLASGDGGGVPNGSKFFLAPFFAVHYGIFTLVHGVFVFAVFQNGGFFGNGMNGGPFETAGQMIPLLIFPAIGLFVSHLFSFFVNFIAGGEYREKSPALMMAAPYGRVIILHVTIIFGGFITMALGSPKFVILLLVFFKTIVDLGFHMREHGKV
jgi:hypothetical protein